MKKKANLESVVAFTMLISSFFLGACSTTSGVPEGERLYTGIDKVKFENYEKNDHFITTQEEVLAALDCPPNGALFSSSYYRSPIQTRLWIWNAYHEKDTPFAKWMTNSFGKAPVLIDQVNPELRASVAQSTLNVHGYFQGKVTSSEVVGKNPKKAKVAYNVDMGPLYTVDTLAYVNFPTRAKALIDSTMEYAYVTRDVPFDVEYLDKERNRISQLFRNNGYYYYQSGYASYLADTFAIPQKAVLKLQLADSLPENAMKQWYVGNISINLRKTIREQLTDSVQRRRLTVKYNGDNPPMRMGVIFNDMKVRPGRLFCYDDYLESASKLGSNGIFSSVDFTFTPRDTTMACDTLDLRLNCVFDRPYDFYVESNLKGKTTGFLGPQLVIGLTKRNALKGGEKLDVNLHGNYEWQTGHAFDDTESKINSYEYGGDVALEIPRIQYPWDFFKKTNTGFRDRPAQSSQSSQEEARRRRRRRFFSTPSTIIKASTNMVNRSGYFRRHIVSGELTYKFQKNAFWTFLVTPLSVEYNYFNRRTDRFVDMLVEHPYLLATMQDVFINKMKVTATYTNASTSRSPFFCSASVSEAGNLLSLGFMAAGKEWNKKNKELFKNPYAQFVKFDTEMSKLWRLSESSQVVGHLSAGVAFPFGNSDYVPYTEQYWVGGANSIRAFNVRSLGPGKFHSDDKRWRFVEEVGNVKVQANLEYRTRLFGKLHGALFLDAGNVWDTESFDEMEENTFKASRFLDDLALGTGIGLRYDLDFFVVRIDWGIGIHAPYDTGKSGYFNIPSFKDGQCLHFAIGYPF
ncbi:MAG: BamA/TamA family outer membrane protein [Prevotella sp.]|nr:BamA/TamA family outer membrane protein [Prevotella sp.]